MLNQELTALCAWIMDDIGIKISSERKSILEDIALQIDLEMRDGNGVKLVYLCTHNSRRSHFSQVWGCIASLFFGFRRISKTYHF